MSAQAMLDEETSVQINRRPRIALMGEFSAGKSTLANLLLGQDVSPVKVTATQLPPIWYRAGPPSVTRIDNAGVASALDPGLLDTVSHVDTQALRILLKAEVLDFCDLIDMPGTSDPNMPPEIWERMLSRCDAVVWCTAATQAWRQSEAAVWQHLPCALRPRSLLLVTRMDKLQTQSDRDRVLMRVRRETEGLFAAVLPISLTEAIAAQDNSDALHRCGAEQFAECLVEMVDGIGPLSADKGPLSSLDFGAINSPQACAPQTSLKPASLGMAQDAVIPRRVVSKRERRQHARP